ncbi:FG-GAP repeat domain-containing protein [Cellulomonas sp. NPDC055163]
MALAQRCGAEVEVLSARTEWNTTVALPDGSMRLEVSTGAVRTKASGEWADVDPTLVPAEDGGFTVASAVAPMSFSAGGDGEEFAAIERDGHELAFGMPFDLPEPTVDGSQLTYDEVLPGVDLVVTVNEDATGFSEVLRVESPEAAAHPDLADLTFPVVSSDGIEVEAQDGGFVATDGAGATVFASPTPAMWDSSAAEPAASGAPDAAVGAELAEGDPTVEPVGGEDVAVLPAEVTADEVTITPDADMLADPQTVWPVYIDPGVSGALNRRSAVRTAVGTRYDFTGDEGVGLCSRATSTTCSTTFQSRLLWQFAGLQDIGNVASSDITGATFAVTGTHSYSCTPQPVTLYAVADFDQGTAYPGGGYWNPLQTHVIAHRAGCGGGSEPRRIEFDASAQARAVADANTAQASFGIAVDESSMAYWKRYGWDASFSVTYNRAPNAPAAVRITDPGAACVNGAGRPYIRTSTPTFAAQLSDPEGDAVHAAFDVFSAVNTAHHVWDGGLTPAQGSGAEHAVRFPGPLNDGGLYQWRVAGVDTAGLTGPTTVCEFAVDLTAPAQPTVQSSPGQPAQYKEDTLAGGSGIPGLLTFGNGGSADVVRYEYSFDSEAFDLSTPASSTTISYAPPTGGPHRLFVRSVDAAGWASPKREYRIVVDTAALSEAWKLDDADGTVAVSMSGTAPLTVSGGVTRTPGLGWFTNRADQALAFDAAGEVASSSRPVVRTAGSSYSVMAFARLDDTNGTYAAVSQDGQRVSGFTLGHRKDPSCPTGTGSCWAFWVPSSDAGGAPEVAVMSQEPVTPGSWVQLAGSRTAAGDLQLSVCRIGSAENPVEEPDAIGATPVRAPAPWQAAGAFRVGQAKVAGAPARGWRGAVSEVRTYTSELIAGKLFTSCTNPSTIAPGLDTTTPTVPKRNTDGTDFDGDGTADVFWSDPADGRWRISWGGVSPYVGVNSAREAPGDALRFGDFDGDGKDDVFFADPAERRWKVSYGATQPWQPLAYAEAATGDLVIADMDGDKKDDVFWVNPADSTWYFSSGGTASWVRLNSAAGVRATDLRLGDLDGDRKDDVFYAHPDGRWLVSWAGTSAWAQIGAGRVPNEQLALGDLTGDGKADVFWSNPADGRWYVSHGGVTGWNPLISEPGVRTDQLQLADVDGDEKTDVFFADASGRWRFSSGGTKAWAQLNSASTPADQLRVQDRVSALAAQNAANASRVLDFGLTTDVRFSGDWNGDGIDTVGVFRDGKFWLNDQNDDSPVEYAFLFGNHDDVPVVGDWNGDGIDTVGVFRGGYWYLNDQNDASASEHVFQYGNGTDRPLVGDWNADGFDTAGVWRAGEWYLNDQHDGSAPDHAFLYGTATDVPVVGDWNGDRRDTVGVWRAGTWHLNDQFDGYAENVFTFGRSTHVPVTGNWDGSGGTSAGSVDGRRWYLNDHNWPG